MSSEETETTIQSPNFPNHPDPHSECEWVIMAPHDKELMIEFQDPFDITYDWRCVIPVMQHFMCY